MPIGLVVLHWSDREGMVIEADYPKGIGISSKLSGPTLLQIYNMHFSGKEAGVIGLTLEDVNFVSYSAGIDSRDFIALLLNLLENQEDFEEKLIDVSNKILDNLDEDKYIEMLPSLYEELIKI